MLNSKLRFYIKKLPFNFKVFKKLFIILIVFFILIYLCLDYLFSRRAPIKGWYPDTPRDMALYLQPNVNTTKIHPWKICQKDDNILLLIGITTSTNHFKERQTIRETYGNVTAFNYPMFKKIHQHSNGRYVNIDHELYKQFLIPYQKNTQTPEENLKYLVKVMFIIGKTNDADIQNNLIKESDVNHDILQEDFMDTYYNLTIKSGMMFKWVSENCLKNVKFVMKIDDDSFLNLPNLLQILLGGTVPVYQAALFRYNSKQSTHFENLLPYSEKLVTGFGLSNVKPISFRYNKWYTPRYLFDDEVFPSFVGGPGYLMSIDALKQIYEASITTPFFHLEDVYFTGICAQKVHIFSRNNPLFYNDKLKEKCAMKGLIQGTDFTSDEIRDLYNFIISDATCS